MTLHGDYAGQVGKWTGLSAARCDAAPVGFPGNLAEPCLPAERTLGRAGSTSVRLMTTLGLVSTLPQSCGCICSPEDAELEGAVLQSLPAVHLHGGPVGRGLFLPPPAPYLAPHPPRTLQPRLPLASPQFPSICRCCRPGKPVIKVN